jgi:hypothetical protein
VAVPPGQERLLAAEKNHRIRETRFTLRSGGRAGRTLLLAKWAAESVPKTLTVLDAELTLPAVMMRARAA